MTQAQITTGTRAKKQRSYFPFAGGLRSQFLAGSGANYQLNLRQNDGFLRKVKQPELKVDTGLDEIDYVSSFELPDGTSQALVFGLIGSDIKLRVIKPDNTVITPGGSLFDHTFTGTVTARQFGAIALISDSSGTIKWDGADLEPLADPVTDNIISTARDGARLAYIKSDGTAHFSDNTPITGFVDGTGANANGDYNTAIQVATAIIEGGTGVIIFGNDGAEAHWVQPNNASDEVSSRTKIESFQFTRNGVANERFVAKTEDSIVFMNADGVFEMNPFSGQTIELTEGGRIERYWNDQIDPSTGFICYDPINNLIMANVSLNSSQNNTWIVFNKNTKEVEPFS